MGFQNLASQRLRLPGAVVLLGRVELGRGPADKKDKVRTPASTRVALFLFYDVWVFHNNFYLEKGLKAINGEEHIWKRDLGLKPAYTMHWCVALSNFLSPWFLYNEANNKLGQPASLHMKSCYETIYMEVPGWYWLEYCIHRWSLAWAQPPPLLIGWALSHVSLHCWVLLPYWIYRLSVVSFSLGLNSTFRHLTFWYYQESHYSILEGHHFSA